MGLRRMASLHPAEPGEPVLHFWSEDYLLQNQSFRVAVQRQSEGEFSFAQALLPVVLFYLGFQLIE